MRIALFSRYPRSFDSPRGGVETVTVILARSLAENEVNDVQVITLEKGLREPIEERDGAVRIVRLPGSRWPQVLDIHIGPGRRRLLAHLARTRPDILHSHETHGLALGARPSGVPHLFTLHGFDHANIPTEGRRMAGARARLWKWVERRGLARLQDVVSISPYVLDMIRPHTSAQIHEIDNPVDPRFFTIARREETGRVLVVGWINPRKNTLGSVLAFGAAYSACRQGKLVIAGHAKSEAYLSRVRDAAVSSGVDKQVEFLGHITQERLAEEMSRASLLLLPSFQENAPMVVAEAMAMGLPVVTSNICGMPFMVEEGASGYLVDPGDTAMIAERIARLFTQASMRETMGRRGGAIALARFHPAKVAERTLAVYRSIVSARGAGGASAGPGARGSGV